MTAAKKVAGKGKTTSSTRRKRKSPGTGGAGRFYRIEIRPKDDFMTFRTQDVGKKGGLERIAGQRRSSGKWSTVTWLLEKKHAHVSKGRLVIDNAKEKAVLAKAVAGPIMWKKGDVFTAHPAKKGASKRARTTSTTKVRAKRTT